MHAAHLHLSCGKFTGNYWQLSTFVKISEQFLKRFTTKSVPLPPTFSQQARRWAVGLRAIIDNDISLSETQHWPHTPEQLPTIFHKLHSIRVMTGFITGDKIN